MIKLAKDKSLNTITLSFVPVSVVTIGFHRRLKKCSRSLVLVANEGSAAEVGLIFFALG